MVQTTSGIDSGSEVVYLLGLSPRAGEATRQRLRQGLEMVECRSEGNVDCWFVRVDRNQFEGPQAEQNLSDLAWLSPRVMAHQSVVEQLSAELPFYPARFGTLFNDAHRLAELVTANRRTLTEFFAGDARHVEWGLKCYVDWPRAVDAYHSSGQGEVDGGPGNGASYLRRKKMIRDRDQEVRRWLGVAMEEIRSAVSTIAMRVCERGTAGVPAEENWECLANLALLVARERQRELEAWVEERSASAAGTDQLITLRLTGPWPLYSFLPELAST